MKLESKKKDISKKIQGGHVYQGKPAEKYLRKVGVRAGLPIKTDKDYKSHMDKMKKHDDDFAERVKHFHDK